MRSSESIDKIAPALVNALGELSNAVKDSTNPHFKSRYAALDGVVADVRPMLATHDIACIQQAITDERGVGCITTFLHKSGQWIEAGELVLPVKKRDDPQAAMSTLTYARRGALMAAAFVAPTDDDDGNRGAQAPAQRPPVSAPTNQGPTSNQIDMATDLYDRLGQTGEGEDVEAFKGVWMETVKAHKDGRITPTQYGELADSKDKIKKALGL